MSITKEQLTKLAWDASLTTLGAVAAGFAGKKPSVNRLVCLWPVQVLRKWLLLLTLVRLSFSIFKQKSISLMSLDSKNNLFVSSLRRDK